MGSVRVLIIAPDGAERTVVGSWLAARGYQTYFAADDTEAFRRISEAVPDAILVVPESPGLDLSAFIRTLRTSPETALIPVLFIADKNSLDAQLGSYRFAADDYVPQPFDPQELDLRIAVALKVREKTENALRPKSTVPDDFSSPSLLTAFRGSLDQIGLPTLLTLFDMERKTGMLVLVMEPKKVKVRLYFLEGRVVRARIDGHEQPRNADLLYGLLDKTQGKFDFRPLVIDPRDEIRTPTSLLLLEGARLLDETRRTTRPPESEA